MDREIPDDDAARLRTLTGLAELPPKVAQKYWELARLATRQNDAVRDYDLRWLCFHLGYGKPFEREANPTIADLYRKGEVRVGDPVKVKRGKRTLRGTFRGLGTGNLARVLVDGDGMDEFDAADVKPESLVSA
jgi:hypothetical protein